MTDHRRAIAVLLGCLIAASAVVQLAVRPRLHDADQLAAQTKEQRQQAATLDQEVGALRAAFAQAQANRRALRELGRALPAEPQPARLLRRLDATARTHGVELRDLAVTPAGAAAGSAPGVAQTALGPALPLTLSFAGEYGDIGRLARQLAAWVSDDGQQLKVHGRLVTLDGFMLKNDPEGAGLDASATLTAFLAPLEEQP